MKKILNYCFCSLFCIYSFFCACVHPHPVINYFESVFYFAWCVGFAYFFYDTISDIATLKMKIVLGVLSSAVSTAVIFFANTYFRYCWFSFERDWYVEYADVIRWDITYTYATGWMRYPAVFVFMLVICAMCIYLPKCKLFKKETE